MRGSPARCRLAGIALVLASGLLVVFSFLGLLIVRMTRFAAAGTDLAVTAFRAELCAESGMEYVVARLQQDGCPRKPPSPGSAAPFPDRGDDWTFHDGPAVPPEEALNPSYGHGESWNELGGRAGLYDRGLDALAPGSDLDGSGAFTAWSGRLRGGRPLETLFILKIEAPGGKIPVNAGWLGAQDLWGGFGAFQGNGIPDHRDLDIYHHVSIARLLDNLGAQAGVSTRSIEASTGTGGQGETFRTTRLGTDLIGNRPAAGYSGPADVAAVLESLGYLAVEIDGVLPYLDFGLPEVEGGRPPYPGIEWAAQAPYAPIEMQGASREVLASVWRYMATRPLGGKLYGEPDAWGTFYARAGPDGVTFAEAALVIFPDEAERLADWAVSLKGGDRPACWREFYEGILEEAMDLFGADRDNLQGFPEAQESWTRAKAEMAFSAVCADSPLPELGLYRAGSWGLFCSAPPAGRVHAVGARRWDQIGFVAPPAEAGGTWRFDPPDQPYIYGPAACYPQGLTIDPPIRFEAACEARVAAGGTGMARQAARGDLRVAERLVFTSQEDFENYGGGMLLSKRGIRVHDPAPVKRFDGREDEAPNLSGPPGSSAYRRSPYPHAASLPAWPLRSGTVGSFWYGMGGSTPILFSRMAGGIGLSRREGGTQGADQYWCLSQRFDGDPADDFRSEPEAGSSYGPAEAAGEADQAWHTKITHDALPHAEAFENFSVEAWITSDWQDVILDNRKILFSDAVTWEAQTGGRTRTVRSDLSIALFRTTSSAYQDHAKVKVNLVWDTGHGGSGSGGSGGGVPPPPGGGTGGGGVGGAPDAPSGPGGGPGTGGTGGGTGSGSGSGGTGDPFTYASMTVEIDDVDASGAVRSGHYHVVLTMVYDAAADKTLFDLYVDGKPAPGGRMTALGKVTVHPPLALSTRDAAELRIHWGKVLSPPEVEGRYRLGRFVRGGALFRSPVYVTGAGTEVGDVHWAGFLPPELAARGIGMSVRFQPCDDRGNATAPPVLLGTGGEPVGVSETAGRLEAFRYEVEFTDLLPPDEPLLETPIFESLTLTLKRPGRSPGWTGWGR